VPLKTNLAYLALKMPAAVLLMHPCNSLVKKVSIQMTSSSVETKFGAMHPLFPFLPLELGQF